MAGSGDRTEKPTPRRLQKARREGNVPSSRDLAPAVSFLVFAAFLVRYASDVARLAASGGRVLIRGAFVGAPLTAHRVAETALVLGLRVGAPILAALAVPAVLGAAAHLAAGGFVVSLERLTPKLSRLSPASKLSGLISQQKSHLVKALIALALAVFVSYRELRDHLGPFLRLPGYAAVVGVAEASGVIGRLLIRSALFLAVAAAIDYALQRRDYMKSLRMSKQEIREESKEQDGNPHTKQRIRRIQRDMARKRMMSEVATATTVITNPTHYAVALRYLPDEASAPRVVAKGKNYLAARIRKRALDARVPIVENPPLARALYGAVDVGQEIPAQFYRAVAEILAYIHRIMGSFPSRKR